MQESKRGDVPMQHKRGRADTTELVQQSRCRANNREQTNVFSALKALS
jgi:hypothetical protein